MRLAILLWISSAISLSTLLDAVHSQIEGACSRKCHYEGYVVQVANTWEVTSGTCESWANYVECRKECGDWNDDWERFAHALEIHACAHYVASSSNGYSISISLLTFLSLYVLYHYRELYVI